MTTNAIKALIVLYAYSGYFGEIGENEKDETEILANDTIIKILDKFESKTFEFETFVKDNPITSLTFLFAYYGKAVNLSESEPGPNDDSVGFENAEILRFIVSSIAGIDVRLF